MFRSAWDTTQTFNNLSRASLISSQSLEKIQEVVLMDQDLFHCFLSNVNSNCIWICMDLLFKSNFIRRNLFLLFLANALGTQITIIYTTESSNRDAGEWMTQTLERWMDGMHFLYRRFTHPRKTAEWSLKNHRRSESDY